MLKHRIHLVKTKSLPSNNKWRNTIQKDKGNLVTKYKSSNQHQIITKTQITVRQHILRSTPAIITTHQQWAEVLA